MDDRLLEFMLDCWGHIDQLDRTISPSGNSPISTADRHAAATGLRSIAEGARPFGLRKLEWSATILQNVLENCASWETLGGHLLGDVVAHLKDSLTWIEATGGEIPDDSPHCILKLYELAFPGQECPRLSRTPHPAPAEPANEPLGEAPAAADALPPHSAAQPPEYAPSAARGRDAEMSEERSLPVLLGAVSGDPVAPAGEPRAVLDGPVLREEPPVASGRRTSGDAGVADILAIERSLFVQHLVRQALQTAGYRVTVASTVAAARDVLESGREFQAIVCDADLPEAELCGLVAITANRDEPTPWIGLVSEEEMPSRPPSGFAGAVPRLRTRELLECVQAHCGCGPLPEGRRRAG